LRQVVNFESITLEVPEEISHMQSIGTRWIITASLLWGSWCHKRLLPGVSVDLSGIGIDLSGVGIDLSGISIDLSRVGIDLSGISQL
jgi:hypothetical protein